MTGLSIFSAKFCNHNDIVRNLAESNEVSLITDDHVVRKASELSGIPESKIKRAFSSKTSVFNTFTHEKECSIAYLRMAVSLMIGDNDFIISGYTGLLIPRRIQHILRVCLVSSIEDRIKNGAEHLTLSSEDIQQAIEREDTNISEWTNLLFYQTDPWNPELYDMVLPMASTEPDKASAIIQENLLKDALRPTAESKSAVSDFQLASKVEVELARKGHNVAVVSEQGRIELSIHQQVLMLSRLEDELISIVKSIQGVDSISVQVNPEPRRPAVYRRFNFDMPSKLLLVDDEREFIQTLSERLQMRDMGSVVAYDGKSALELVHNDEPEVMIIDLKMPGIDGMQVLEEVKKIRPQIEVIVLTGHGSEQDRLDCMEMGAFDYMQKPVDINQLSSLLKKAHEKINSAKQSSPLKGN